MLEMTKTVLCKVSFDTALFRKELSKALRWLRSDERLVLKAWALATFAGIHRQIILDVFESLH